MISIDTLTPLVAPEAPGCPEPNLKLALKQAAQDFFRDTESWRIEDDPTTAAVGQSLVQLGVPSNGMLLNIYTLAVNGVEVLPTLPETVAAADPNWISSTDNKVAGYWIVDPDSIRLYKVPSVAMTVQAYFSVVPTLDNDQLPDFMALHVQTLAHGALWKLQSQVAQPWTNTERADYHGNLFNSLCIQAKIRATRQGGNGLSLQLRRG